MAPATRLHGNTWLAHQYIAEHVEGPAGAKPDAAPVDTDRDQTGGASQQTAGNRVGDDIGQIRTAAVRCARRSAGLGLRSSAAFFANDDSTNDSRGAMNHYVCATCGAQFAASPTPPATCPICDDERQYIGPRGQQWTTLATLRHDHHNLVSPVADNLTGIMTEPKVAIGQQAHLIATPAGNLLWNCISYIDDDTVAAVNERGGLAAIAISHPHFSTGMVEWSHAFGGVPVYLHADDRQWVMRPDEAVHFWEGETLDPLPGSGLTLIRCGGHFLGSSVLHWPAGAGGKGALLTGDTIMVVPDRRWVSFMYSYPNLIPLDAAAIAQIVTAVEPYQFDRIYGSWPESIVASDAKAAVRRSAERYIARIGQEVVSAAGSSR